MIATNGMKYFSKSSDILHIICHCEVSRKAALFATASLHSGISIGFASENVMRFLNCIKEIVLYFWVLKDIKFLFLYI